MEDNTEEENNSEEPKKKRGFFSTIGAIFTELNERGLERDRIRAEKKQRAKEIQEEARNWAIGIEQGKRESRPADFGFLQESIRRNTGGNTFSQNIRDSQKRDRKKFGPFS